MPEVEPKPEPIIAEKLFVRPVTRESVSKVSLPQSQHFTVTLGGKDYCVRAELKDMPKVVQDYILALGEAQAEGLLRG